jgi:hypothetical protein
MPRIELKKRGSGEAVVTFVRDDGTSTSGRLGEAGFGATHDLAHYVVETTLRTEAGFYGLLAGGRAIPDFERKGAAREISDDAIAVECIVGQLTNFIFNSAEPAAGEFNWLVAEALRGVRPQGRAPGIDDATLRAMTAQLRDLVRCWHELPPGGTLELPWPIA